MTNPERNVLVDENTYYDLRDLTEEIEDLLDVGELADTETSVVEMESAKGLLERASGILRELTWKYEESQSVEANSQDD